MGASILPFLTLFPLYRSLPVFLSVQLIPAFSHLCSELLQIGKFALRPIVSSQAADQRQRLRKWRGFGWDVC